MKKFFLFLLLATAAWAQNTPSAAVTKNPNTYAIDENLVFGPARTLTINGTLAGTPAGGALNLSALTLTLPSNYLTSAQVAAGYQPLNSNLTSIAALSTTSAGRSLLTAGTLSAAGIGLTNGSNLDALGAISATAFGRSLLALNSLNGAAVTTMSGTAGQVLVNGSGTAAASGAVTVSLPTTITQAETFSPSTPIPSTNSSTGAVVLPGNNGLGVGGNINAGGYVSSGNLNGPLFASAGIFTTQAPQAPPAQGLLWSGGIGSMVYGMPAFGTGNFMVSVRVMLTGNPTAYSVLIPVTAGSLDFGIGTNRTVNVAIRGGSSVLNPAAVLSIGVPHILTYVRSGTTGTLYVDGLVTGTATDSNTYVAGTSTGFGSTLAYGSEATPLVALNFAPSSTELALFHSTGEIPQGWIADLSSPPNTTIYASNFSAGIDGWAMANGNSANWTVTGNVDGISGQDDNLSLVWNGSASGTLQFLHNVASGPSAGKWAKVTISWFFSAGSGIPYFGPNGASAVAVTEGVWQTATFLCKPSYLPYLYFAGWQDVGEMTWANIVAGKTLYVRGVSVVALGAQFALDPTQPGSGAVGLDASGTGNHILLPSSGSSWLVPASDPLTLGRRFQNEASKQPGQGLIYNGSVTATVAFPAAGTSDYFFAARIRVPSIPSSACYLMPYLANALFIQVNTGGGITWGLAGGTTFGANVVLPLGRDSILSLRRASGVSYLSIDGVVVYTVTDANNYSVASSGSGLGQGAPAGSEITPLAYLVGYAPTAAEIAQFTQTGAIPYGWSTYARFLFDPSQPGTGLIAYDASGNGNHITLPASGVTWARPAGAAAPLKHLAGTTSAPTIAAGASAGTSPTVSVAGTDMSGTISITTGTSTTASGTLATITFNSAYTASPKVTITPANAAAAALTGTSTPYVNDASGTTTTFLISANSTALTASTAYKWVYTVIQ